MIYGIGADMLSKSRLDDLRGKYDDAFFKKTFTEAEYSTGIARPDPILYFSERFAAKEAVFKAISISGDNFKLRDIETLNDESGKPFVNLYGHTKEHCDNAGVTRLHVSLSNDGGFVIAFAVCEVREPV